MGNKVGSLQKPVIMTKTFLEEKIISELARVEGLNSSELRRLIKIDGIEENLVLSLKLEHENLLNIDNLWKFTLLTKLEIANNYIEEIEGLETLLHLQYLDLSFNCIKMIKGLDSLINLEYLNLSYNEISKLENLENQKNLEALVIRHNKIESFKNIYYLSQFGNLLCFAIGENPVTLKENARWHILAILPQLKFLDFVLVTENEVREALLLNPIVNRPSSKSKLFESHVDKNFSSLWKLHPSDKEAFVDGLANGHGFEVLLENDKNFRLLNSFPPAVSIAEKHRKELGELFDDWHAKGRNYYEQMQEEKKNFTEMVKEAERFAENVSEEEEYSFITFTEEVPKELCLIFQRPISFELKDLEVEKLKDECYKKLRRIQKNLMSTTCLYIGLLFDLAKVFNNEMNLIKKKYLEDVQYIYEEIIKRDEIHILQLKQFYFKIFNTGSNYDLEIKNKDGDVVKLDSQFLRLLTKKDFVEMALEMAFTIHSTLLQERIKKLATSLESYREETLNSSIRENMLAQQKKIRNVVLFSNKQKFIMDKFFSNSMKIKNYLGYT